MKIILPALLFFLPVMFLGAEPAEKEIDAYRAAMRALADESRTEGMELEAKVTESRIWEDPAFGFFVPRPPRQQRSALPDDARPNQRAWFGKMRAIEQDYAARLMARAKELAEAGRGRDGWLAARAAFFIDPDNAEARAVFGYRLSGGRWLREWEIARSGKGYINDPEFGWITPKEKRRLDAAPEPDDSPKSGKSRIETEHFDLKTTVPRRTAVRLASRLEDFYFVWHLLFYPMSVTEKEAAASVLGKRDAPAAKHKVILLRDRAEYMREALRLDSNAAISSGGYFPDKKTVYLYLPDTENDEETPLEVMAVHETAHQLFAETGFIPGAAQRRRADPGRESQFWLTEGIACYLETFEETSRGWNVGGLKSYRFVRAKERADEPDGLLPIALLAEKGKEAFQRDANPAKLYTESAGLVSFLFHGEGGKYRVSFLKTLQVLYRGGENPELLEEMTGVSYPQLDEEFHAFLRETPFTE
ncbi:MAG: hypothetical protein IJJ20_06440 [Thermoguttaceae bacterium]|nr:hypothetical protein [Thermoguttaceae bacterium]